MKRKGLNIILILVLFLTISNIFIQPVRAAPANAYWVGDSGIWSDAANHWALATGGAPGAGNLPDATTNVHFDGNSFTIGGQTVNINSTAYSLAMDWTGATNTPTFAVNSNALVYGSITTIAAMTMSGTASLYLYGGGTRTVTTNGLIWTAVLNTDAAGFTGIVNLADDLTCREIKISKGTWNFNNANVTSVLGVSILGIGAKTINLGTVIINTASWSDTSTAGVATIDPGTSTIKVTGTGVFTSRGHTYYNVELNGTAHTISGSSIFNTLTLKANTTQTITFTDATTQIITTPVFTGSPGKIKTLQGSGVAGWTVTKAGGGVVAANYLNLSYSTGTPTDTWSYGCNSTIGAGVVGWGQIAIALYIDGIQQDYTCLPADFSIEDTAYDWIVSYNATAPYIERHRQWAGGNLVQDIAWEYSDNFTDLSGTGNYAIPSFRSASSDPDVSANMTAFLQVAQSQAPDYTLDPSVPFIDADSLTGNVTSTFNITPAAGGFPLAGVIVAVADATSTPSQLPLLIIAGFIILAISLTMSALMRTYGSGTIIVKLITIAAVMGIFIALKNFGIDFWMLIVFLIISVAMAMASRQLGWT